MKQKIVISESQYKRLFLNEQMLSNPSSFDSEAYKRGKAREFERQTAALASFNPTNKFKLAQSQWAKFGAENPKTGRNLIPQSTIDELGKQYREAVKQYNLTHYDVEDPNDKDYQMKKWQDDVLMYGDTESGGIAQTLKVGDIRFGPKGYEPISAKSMRDADRMQIERDIPFIAAVEYNNNINQQKELIPQYCKKPNLTKWYYEFICGSGECDEVSDETWKRLNKRKAEKSGGKYGWYNKNIKAGIPRYGYYLAFRDDAGQDPFTLCANSTSKGVWVYDTKYGYHCGCYKSSNQKYMSDLGVSGEDYLLGLDQKFKKYKKDNAPGFLEVLGDCFSDYHCVLDIASIAALAIPGVGLAVSAGLDFLNAAAYGVEAATADTSADRNAAILAGGLTLFGGLLGGGVSQTRRLLTKGARNPKIYKYANEVTERIKKELPNIKKMPKDNTTILGNNLITDELAKIYKETAEKYGLKETDILLAHDILKDFAKIDVDIVKKYTEALKTIDSKVGRGNLTKVGKEPKFQKMLLENDGDVVITLKEYLGMVARKEAILEGTLFVTLMGAMEDPIVQEWIANKYNYIKYRNRKDIRGLVEKEGYDWDSTKQTFNSTGSAEDNNLLKAAWLKGWRPYPAHIKEPTEKDLLNAFKWLMNNPKYQTKSFKSRFGKEKKERQVAPKDPKDRKENVVYYHDQKTVDEFNSMDDNYTDEEYDTAKNIMNNLISDNK